MICKNCKSEVTESTLICSECGSRVALDSQESVVNDARKAFYKARENSFRTPIFIVVAICLSVVCIANLLGVIISAGSLVPMLSLVFFAISTVCAWLLVAGKCTDKRIKTFGIFASFSSVINTIVLVLACLAGAVLIIACVFFMIVGGVVKETVVPMLNQEIRPMLVELAAHAEEIEESGLDYTYTEQDLAEFKEQFSPEAAAILGISDVQDLQESVRDMGRHAGKALLIIDLITETLEKSLVSLTVKVTLSVAAVIVCLVLIKKGFKKTAAYLKTVSKGLKPDKAPPSVSLYIAGALLLICGVAYAFLDLFSGIALVAEAIALIFLAVLFRSVTSAQAEVCETLDAAELKLEETRRLTELELARIAESAREGEAKLESDLAAEAAAEKPE